MSSSKQQINNIISRLQASIKESIAKEQIQDVGDFARDVVVRRTRLGYGTFGKAKVKFAPLKDGYVAQRKKFKFLDNTTTPRKSNLTRTGELLRSITAFSKISKTAGAVTIAPDGERNVAVAGYAHDGSKNRPKRPFLFLTDLEFKQVLRFYRKNFGDLLRKRNLIS